MEQKIDELLKQLHKFLFADSDQVVNELRIYLLDESLKEAELEIIFFNSKLIMKLSLLEFLRQNSLQQDKLLSSVKKKVYELIVDYLKLRSQEVSPYLSQIKETCLQKDNFNPGDIFRVKVIMDFVTNKCLLSFRSDTNSLVKESSLQLVIKIIETYNVREIESLIKPRDMMVMLLDEIKLRRPSARLLHDKYGLEEFRVESQDVMFIQLQEQMKSEKPEIKAIIGIIKGLTHSLIGECTLDDDQVEALYRSLKIAIQPIEDMQHKGVMKAAMKLLELCVNENMETRDTANELLAQLIQQISDGLTRDQSIHRDIFRNIMLKIQEILDDTSHTNVLLISTIKAVGIFSKAIQTFMGDEQLYKYLENLIQVSENKIIKEFEQQDDPKSDFKNFKQILKKQKQLQLNQYLKLQCFIISLLVSQVLIILSFIESYSYILSNLKQEPSESFLLHFHKVCEIGVRHHRKLYPKYRQRFYEALASFTKALAFHKAPFSLWIKKFIRASLIETLYFSHNW